jgi:hypothetical protein
VEREQRRLDGEGDEEAAEQRDLDRGATSRADSCSKAKVPSPWLADTT